VDRESRLTSDLFNTLSQFSPSYGAPTATGPEGTADEIGSIPDICAAGFGFLLAPSFGLFGGGKGPGLVVGELGGPVGAVAERLVL
jgi:hypothetical protein